MSDAIELVERYVAAGIAVLPLHKPHDGGCSCGWSKCLAVAKHPAIRYAHRFDDPARKTCKGECGRPGHGLYDATTDLGVIAEWAARFPGCNWGGRPPVGVVVLDVDPRNDGHVHLAELEREHGTLPSTLTAQTGSGGLHHWIGYNGPARGKLCTGVDVKTNRGYVVLPPSVHASGGRYFWLDESPAIVAPEWVRAILNPPTRTYHGRTGARGIAAIVEWYTKTATAGERNDPLYWAACRAIEQGLDPSPLIEAAVAAGHDPRMSAATVASATNATPRARSRIESRCA